MPPLRSAESTYRPEPAVARTKFAIIADDLTGACDSAVAFAERGLSAEVTLDTESSSAADVWAISTESRDVSISEMERRVRHAAAWAADAEQVFKKVDSVLRGNSFTEVRLAAQCIPSDLVIFSPAHPRLRRTVREGTLQIHDAAGQQWIDIREKLADAGLPEVPIISAGRDINSERRQLEAAITSGHRVVLCDSVNQQDLELTVDAAQTLGIRLLWIGSGGLAHALASEIKIEPHLTHSVPLRRGVLILFIGSDHPVTQNQMNTLRLRARIMESTVENFSGAPAGQTVLVLYVTRGSTTQHEIARAMQHVSIDDVSCCFLTGGDTAMLVCRSLSMRSITMEQQFAPGLACGIAHGGLLQGVPLVLKSGGFGEPDVLWQLACSFAEERSW